MKPKQTAKRRTTCIGVDQAAPRTGTGNRMISIGAATTDCSAKTTGTGTLTQQEIIRYAPIEQQSAPPRLCIPCSRTSVLPCTAAVSVAVLCSYFAPHLSALHVEFHAVEKLLLLLGYLSFRFTAQPPLLPQHANERTRPNQTPRRRNKRAIRDAATRSATSIYVNITPGCGIKSANAVNSRMV